MARRRFFVESIERGRAELYGDDAYHLTRVLRVEAGQKFEISDNRRVFLAEVAVASKDSVTFSILEEIAVPGPAVRTALFASLIKFERFEWMLEKATELGVGEVIPVLAGRSEKGLERAVGKRLERWNRIAREASEQSRRARLPLIQSAVDLADALSNESEYRYVLEEEDAPPMFALLPKSRKPEDRVSLLAGPEGGWTDRERSSIRAAGLTAVSLGQTILRTETAALAALAVVNAAWGVRG